MQLVLDLLHMPGPAFLHGDRLTLRTVEEHDYDFIHRHWNDPSIRRGTNRQTPQTERAISEFFEESDDVHVLPCHDGDPVGFACLFNIDQIADRGELGYWIIPAEQGNGYATEAAALGATYAFDELGLNKVMARVSKGNDASMRVLEKIGFEQEGTLRDHYWINGAYVDTYLYGRLATER